MKSCLCKAMELKESINLFKASVSRELISNKHHTAYPKNDSLNKFQITLSELLGPYPVQNFHNTGLTSTSLIPNQKVDL